MRTIVSILVFLLSLLLCWYGGADFTQRSFGSAWCVGMSIYFGGATYLFPGWANK